MYTPDYVPSACFWHILCYGFVLRVVFVAVQRSQFYAFPCTQAEWYTALTGNSVAGIMKLPNNVFHLLVGLNPDQYASETMGQINDPKVLQGGAAPII